MDESITYSELQSNLEISLDRVSKGHTPLLVKREKGKDVVIMSKDDYASMEETMHLLRSPKNAERLMEAVHRDESKHIKFDSMEDLEREIGI